VLHSNVLRRNSHHFIPPPPPPPLRLPSFTPVLRLLFVSQDRRVKVSHAGAAVQGGSTGGKSEGTSKALTTFIDPSLSWDDLSWFRCWPAPSAFLRRAHSRAAASPCSLAGQSRACASCSRALVLQTTPSWRSKRSGPRHSRSLLLAAALPSLAELDLRERTASFCRITAVASWTLRAPASRCCPRPWLP
jgi:hypothetical protein